MSGATAATPPTRPPPAPEQRPIACPVCRRHLGWAEQGRVVVKCQSCKRWRVVVL